MYELKPLSREAIPAALEKAYRYRLLNEPLEAESICRDILVAEPGNQEAAVTLLLALTDQFEDHPNPCLEQARQALTQIRDEYSRTYHAGIICERRAKAQLKRGGAQNFLPLDEEQAKDAESLFQTHSATSSEDRIFERSWAEALVAAGMERLSAEYKSESREKLFKELRIFLGGGADPPPTYAELAARLGMTESTLRSHVTRLRTHYRDALRAEVRKTVDSEAQVDEELHELLRVLTRG